MGEESAQKSQFFTDAFNKVFQDCAPETTLLSLAITGKRRSGKSFLLNMMVTYLEYLEKVGDVKNLLKPRNSYYQ